MRTSNHSCYISIVRRVWSLSLFPPLWICPPIKAQLAWHPESFIADCCVMANSVPFQMLMATLVSPRGQLNVLSTMEQRVCLYGFAVTQVLDQCADVWVHWCRAFFFSPLFSLCTFSWLALVSLSGFMSMLVYERAMKTKQRRQLSTR